MTPVKQRTHSDCTQAALATLLDKAYEDLPNICGLDADGYNAAVIALLERERLFMVSFPLTAVGNDGVRFTPGETHCLLTVKSARFEGKQHHVCGTVRAWEADNLWHWAVLVEHDPHKLQESYDITSVDLVFRRL